MLAMNFACIAGSSLDFGFFTEGAVEGGGSGKWRTMMPKGHSGARDWGLVGHDEHSDPRLG